MKTSTLRRTCSVTLATIALSAGPAFAGAEHDEHFPPLGATTTGPVHDEHFPPLRATATGPVHDEHFPPVASSSVGTSTADGDLEWSNAAMLAAAAGILGVGAGSMLTVAASRRRRTPAQGV